VIQIRSALRFLYVCTLKQKWFDDEIRHPKKRVTLPGVITVEEVARMLDVTQNLKHWTILATFYGTAVRCKELQQLKVGDMDSQRMVLHVRHGKGGTPRDTFHPGGIPLRLSTSVPFVTCSVRRRSAPASNAAPTRIYFGMPVQRICSMRVRTSARSR